MTHHSSKCCCRVGPSVLNADLSKLAEESKRIVEAGADYLHLDVMDGHFVPNITFGATMVKALRKHLPNTFFDIHMMVSDPEKWIDDMADAGANMYTFHLEATDDPDRVIRMVRAKGMKVGLGVKPNTPVEMLLPFVEKVDMALVMTVEPGFGGQKFMAHMMPKVELLRKQYPDLDIEVDGGLSPSTIKAAVEAGANMIVSGSAVITSDNPREVMNGMKEVGRRWFPCTTDQTAS